MSTIIISGLNGSKLVTQGYGEAEPETIASYPDIIPGGAVVKKTVFPLELGLTLDGRIVWVYPIKLKKGEHS